ncbi:MAG: T9SS type A sorting domain-containing protein [Candidatus Syntrophosphaera sp.]|nr:T9SS type A sorting domain-containing protein [Candidatus Syntrophosphaera sp.]
MKKCLLLLLGILFLTPVVAETWTVLVYMAADNNLWQNAVQDVNDMESVSMPGNLNLIVQTDMPVNSSYPGGQRRRIRQDSSAQITSPLLANLGSIDSGDPQTLKSFINWGFERYPSQRRMLVIWGHGDNWFKQEEFKWICPDDGSQSLMSVANGDLKEALTGIPHLDILLFDACSMQSLEVLAEVMHAADYVIGSAELVPAAGFPYQTMVPLFASLGPEQLAEQIPQKYLESYEPGGVQNPGGFTVPLTCSGIRTSPLPEFYERITNLSLYGVSMAPAIVEHIRDGLWEMNTAYCDVDIAEFIASCSVIPPSLEILYWPYQMLTQWEECVVFAGNLNIPLVAYPVGSAAIWFPWHRQYFDGWWRQYRKLEFASTQWLRFLNRGLGDTVPPDLPEVSEQSVVLGTLQFRIVQPADPDSLSYQVCLFQGSSEDCDVSYFNPAVSEASFWVRLPVWQFGSVTVKCMDTCGNWSESTSFQYEFPEPGLELLMVPNPVRDRLSASARWYLPDGLEGQVDLTLFNIRGQKVLSRSFQQNEAGEGNWLLSAEEEFRHLARGVYVLKLKAGSKWRQQKLTIL